MITLKNLKSATKQEIFDQVAVHLLTQKQRSTKPSVSGGYDCAYRGYDGLKCAAGCLIADDEYKACMDDGGDFEMIDGTSWHDLAGAGVVPDTKHNSFIFKLQMLHDSTEPEGWRVGLFNLAFNNDLNTNAINHLK